MIQRKLKKVTGKPRSHHRQLKAVSDLIRPLGTTTDTIARTLQRLGICGTRGNGYDCPLARYFRQHHYPVTIAVLPSGLYDSRTGTVLGWWPSVVSEFVYWFDSGHYPQLVDRKVGKGGS